MGLAITVIDRRASRHTFGPCRDAGAWAALFTFDEVYMTCVDDMVTSVLQKAGDRKIDLLIVIDHGAHWGLEIGDDRITWWTLGEHIGSLRRLNGHFSADSLGVHFRNCYAGRYPRLLVDLAQILGTPVTAGTGLSIGWWNLGDYITCLPDGTCSTVKSRPRLR